MSGDAAVAYFLDSILNRLEHDGQMWDLRPLEKHLPVIVYSECGSQHEFMGGSFSSGGAESIPATRETDFPAKVTPASSPLRSW